MRRVSSKPSGSRPRVSVVVPCYRYGHFLPACVRSILGQEGVDVDVLIIDDASPDDSAAVARRLADEDARVRVMVHEVNRGHIATYNEGLAAVHGEYVVLLSADDLLAPRSLANATALLDAQPDVGLVYGFTRSFSTEPPPARTTPRSWSVWSGEEWLRLLCLRASNPISTPEVVMRATTMRDLVGYDARLPHAADFLLWLRTANRAAIGRVNGVDLAYYRVHGANMHMERYPGALRDLTERKRAFDILFEEDGAHLPDAAALREAADRGVAREALVVACRAYRRGRPSDEEAEVLARLVELAEQIWPPSRGSRLRRSYDAQVARADRGKGPLLPRRLAELRDRGIDHLRWRRFRRSGIDGALGWL
ncbi:Glycosyltransferase involved in cell wall bisynthesis [Micromonospora echinaurantiaca]|uniref:Glycosyltransferase involved in cell wall bisynthesis n=1 Tax=Micromonospora echinaurantiaca TaxID=47857 RepID=A0A1C5ILH7_9ACTN|nr:Glycosyltransferase involved in cell wall bisynthesis [Micromonospora echinaurantiaca]